MGAEDHGGDHHRDDHERARLIAIAKPRRIGRGSASPFGLVPAPDRWTGLAAVRLPVGRSGGRRALGVPRAGGDPRAGGGHGRGCARERRRRWRWGSQPRRRRGGRTPHRDQPVERRGRGTEAAAGVGEGGGHVVRHRALQAADGARMVREESQTVRVEAVGLDDLGPARGMLVGRRGRREAPVVGPPASERGVELAQTPEEPVQVSARLGLLRPGGGIGRIHVIPSVASAESDHASLQAGSARSATATRRAGAGRPVTIWLRAAAGSVRCVRAVTSPQQWVTGGSLTSGSNDLRARSAIRRGVGRWGRLPARRCHRAPRRCGARHLPDPARGAHPQRAPRGQHAAPPAPHPGVSPRCHACGDPAPQRHQPGHRPAGGRGRLRGRALPRLPARRPGAPGAVRRAPHRVPARSC